MEGNEKKAWDKALETSLLEDWKKSPLRFDPDSTKPIFVIDTPPPYPSGRPWHIGAAAGYAEIDMIARTSRMFGNEVLFPIGIDRNGLPVEIYTEKKYKISMRHTPREKFLELCATALDDLEAEMIGVMKRMGLSGDFEGKYRTDSESYRKLTQATFIEQWNKGMIYIGKRPSNYCVDCGTTIADAEIEYSDFPTKLVYIRFPLVGESKTIEIATTRPEMLASCQVVIVNPSDERYSSFIGKKVALPIYNREVVIVSHPSAKQDFGSGAVMVCSYGDYNDVLIIRELSLPETISIGLDGKMTAPTGALAGEKIKAARQKITAILQEKGFVLKIEEINHRTPICERSKTPIEIIPLEEYYLKVTEFKDKLREEALKIRFHPEAHRQILMNWIDVALDWPITRRRFYGTEVPVWYCDNCSEPLVPSAGGYYQPWKTPPPPGSKCSKCGSLNFKGDERTFDTWMDSSVSALYISRYLSDKKFFEKTYGTGLRPQGKDIIRTWLHYSLLRCLEITGKKPWSDAWINGMGLDEKGERMSKSKGNVIDPIPVLEQYGADNFRLWAASEVSVGSDFNISLQKIAGMGKFLSKLWNISRFVGSHQKLGEREIHYCQSDMWMLGELERLVSECKEGYKDYNFFIPANKIRDFTWNLFASHYIELVKGRAYGQAFSEEEKISAIFTLDKCLKTILLLLAPICPFITEAIWQNTYSAESIHRQNFPKESKEFLQYVEFEKPLLEFNSLIWNEKKAKGVSLKDSITLEIPRELKDFEKDLRAMHNLK